MEDSEHKFRALELDDEIQKLKQKLQNHNPSSETANNQTKSKSNQKYSTQINEKRIRFYAILGLKPDASIKEVKLAYRSLVKKCHPDLFCHNPQLQQKAQEVMMKINEAYTELIER
jgi:DnaJ-domain-containing protein 1